MHIVPRLFFKFSFTPDEKVPDPAFKEGDYAMVILKEFYIGDNREWWVNRAEVNISFEFSTGTDKTVSKIFSTFRKVKDYTNLPIRDIVLLPPIKIEDHFSITVNAIELDAPDNTQIKSIMDTAGKVIDKVLDKVPIPGISAVSSIVTGIVADIVNLVASLNDDDVIMREIVSYLVEKERYPGYDDKRYLKAGELTITEDMSRTRQLLLDENKSIDAASQPQSVPEPTPITKGNLSDASDSSDKSHVKLLIVKAPPRKEKPPKQEPA
jgi:hypothetical protein